MVKTENIFTQASVFSGIGGFDLAAEWMGWENLFNCELEPSCRKVLNHYWPNAESYEDIKTTDFTIWRGRVGVLTGGDPCQPSSFAGLRTGTADPRYLWPEMRRVINEIQPLAVVNENVEGTISNGILDTKISDLENEGYTCWPPIIMPANAFGALHRRNRVWLVAYSERYIESWKESCNRSARRMGREFKPLAWHTHWQTKISDFRGMVNGIPARVDETDGTRNAIVPQIAFQVFKAIESILKP